MIAAVGSPDQILPPLVWETVGRDIGDQVYQRLAVLDPTRSPLDPAAYTPSLAEYWEQIDSLTWRFELREANWHDGAALDADDVVFSFRAYQDSSLVSGALSSLAGVEVTAESPTAVRVVFPEARPDQLYDATYHVRVLPQHIWDSIPRSEWGIGRAPSLYVGSGPYRMTSWNPDQSLILERTGRGKGVARIVWRFAGDPAAAANMMLAGEADAAETIPDPSRRKEFEANSSLQLVPYPSAVYGFLGFNLAAEGALQDVRVRRALTLGSDRQTLVHAVMGPESVVPPGPLSRLLWLWDDAASPPGFDPSAADSLLDSSGWRRPAAGGERQRNGATLAVDILVPATSATRRSLAILLQEQWGRLGITTTITAVDFPVFQERLAGGRFEAFIGAWLDEPHPRSLADQWTRAGWDQLNYTRYANPTFERHLGRAVEASNEGEGRAAWREALRILNDDAPAIWLYTLTNVAVLSARVENATFPPFEWARSIADWTVRSR